MNKDEKMIALIAHDKKKLDLAVFVKDNLELFASLALIATKATGEILEAKTGLKVAKVRSGPVGGDIQIGAMVGDEKIEAVIFFRDPLTAQPHEPDISALLRACDVHNVPLATNLATAEAILDWLKERRE